MSVTKAVHVDVRLLWARGNAGDVLGGHRRRQFGLYERERVQTRG